MKKKKKKKKGAIAVRREHAEIMPPIDVKAVRKFSSLVPDLTPDEFQALKDDIVSRKEVIVPYAVDSEGAILDGNHRHKIAKSRKDVVVPKPLVMRHLTTDAEKKAFVIRMNLNRRQLSGEQKAALREHQAEIARELDKEGKNQEQIAAKIGLSQNRISEILSNDISSIGADNAYTDKRRTISRDEESQIVEELAEGLTQQQIADRHKISQPRVAQVKKKHEAREREEEPFDPDDVPDKRYHCIVIDPPWPIEKIEREVRPDQGDRLDYRTMSIEEIEALPVADLAYKSGTHVYLWVTHRFLPEGLRLFELWGVKYQCVMTWRKNVGITPFSWMYDTEHVLFGRIGSLPLLKNGLRLSFEAKVTKHSAKPGVFYSRVIKASPAPRLDWFGRKERDGFDVIGNREARQCETTI